MPEKREKYGNSDPILDARAKREMYRNLNPLLDARQNENIQELRPTFGRETYRNSDPLLVAKVTSKPICIGGFIKVVNFLIQNPVQCRWWQHSVNPICYPSFTTREREIFCNNCRGWIVCFLRWTLFIDANPVSCWTSHWLTILKIFSNHLHIACTTDPPF